MTSPRKLDARGKRKRRCAFAVVVPLVFATCAGSDQTEVSGSRADELRDKPWQTWSEQDLQWGLGHYDEIYDARRVPAGGAVRGLEAGPPLERLAAESDGGEQLERYLTDLNVAGLLVIQHGQIRLER